MIPQRTVECHGQGARSARSCPTRSASPSRLRSIIYAGTFDYAPRPGQLGPDVWPRLAILLMGASCLFEISRRLIAGNQDATGFLEAFDREPDVEEKQPVYPRLLIGGIVLMAIYAVLVPVLGFILGTFLFLAAFMYVGGYRDAWRHLGHQRRGDDLLRHSVPAHRLCFAAARHRRRSTASPTSSSRSRALW